MQNRYLYRLSFQNSTMLVAPCLNEPQLIALNVFNKVFDVILFLMYFKLHLIIYKCFTPVNVGCATVTEENANESY